MRVGRTVVVRHRRSGGGGGGGSASDWCDKLLKIVLFSLLQALLVYFFWAELHRNRLSVAFTEAEKLLVAIHHSNDRVPYHAIGELVHFKSNDSPIPAEPLRDELFAIDAPERALKIARKTEYCQWMEYSEDHTVKNSDDSETTYRTYYYIKGWHSYRIPSLAFDQPFAHHNPLRDPTPSESIRTTSARVGAFRLNGDLVEATRGTWLPIQLEHSKNHRRSEEFSTSIAANEHNFRYIGDGWFYSEYERDTLTKLFLGVAQLAEGTLLDWQIGDLFSQCTAGDIRVRLEALTPSSVSVVGKLSNADGLIEPYLMSNGYRLGLVHEGHHSHEEMFEREYQEHQFYVYLARVLLFVWAAAIAAIVNNRLELNLGFQSGTVFAVCVGLTAFGFVTLWVWGVSVWMALVTLVAFVGVVRMMRFSNQANQTTIK